MMRSLLDNISFGWRRALPMVLQTEATECGLACLAMIAGFHRHSTDLSSLRGQFSISLKGTTLAHVVQIVAADRKLTHLRGFC
jgi:ATP-binding cassette subfamily B protein RaxB